MSLTTKRTDSHTLALFVNGQRVGEVFRYRFPITRNRYGLRLRGIYWRPSSGAPNTRGGYTTKSYVTQCGAVQGARVAFRFFGMI
ncbi:hypothetical protein GCM10011408_28560 [Dyella caseinilytica]|nr:hypothetical protein GCM10011408_28560 [Dyella caseinilytica]